MMVITVRGYANRFAPDSLDTPSSQMNTLSGRDCSILPSIATDFDVGAHAKMFSSPHNGTCVIHPEVHTACIL